jgi:hypothetical protein
MKATAIIAGVAMLIIYGLCSVPYNIIILGFPVNINPFFLVGSISLITILGFSVTISIITLILAIMLILAGVFKS